MTLLDGSSKTDDKQTFFSFQATRGVIFLKRRRIKETGKIRLVSAKDEGCGGIDHEKKEKKYLGTLKKEGRKKVFF